MQEEVENKTLALVVNGTKFTGRTLKNAISRYLAHRRTVKNQKPKRDSSVVPHGRQTVKKLMNHGEATSSLPVESPRQFDKVARRWNVDYAFYKNDDGKYLLFFKSKQADAITACFGQYSRLVLDRGKSRHVPVREQLKRAAERVRRQPQRDRSKEAEREER